MGNKTTTTKREPPITVLDLIPTGQKQLVTCPLDPSKLVFREFSGSLVDTERNVSVYMEVVIQPEECCIRALTIKANEGVLAHKRLTLEAYLRAFVGHMLFEGDAEGLAHGLVRYHGWDAPRKVRITGNARLKQVAEWYQEAKEHKQSTGKYVAVKAGVQPGYARRLIMEARKAGYLEPRS